MKALPSVTDVLSLTPTRTATRVLVLVLDYVESIDNPSDQPQIATLSRFHDISQIYIPNVRSGYSLSLLSTQRREAEHTDRRLLIRLCRKRAMNLEPSYPCR